MSLEVVLLVSRVTPEPSAFMVWISQLHCTSDARGALERVRGRAQE